MKGRAVLFLLFVQYIKAVFPVVLSPGVYKPRRRRRGEEQEGVKKRENVVYVLHYINQWESYRKREGV